MKHIYRVESIRDDLFTAVRDGRVVKMLSRNPRLIRDVAWARSLGNLPWVAEILGIDQKFRFSRCFIRGQKDYTESNGVGSRGVYLQYILDDGPIYETARLVGWNKPSRYFFRLSEQGEEERLNTQEVKGCLSASEA